MSGPNDLHLYTIGDVEQRLQLSRAKVYDLIRTRQLRSITIGRARRITGDAINDFINTRTHLGD
jgi:excisionase family DNA binding protein